MNLYGLIKVLHILAVTAVISGVVGRALIRARLVRLDDILIVREFVTLEGHFDQWLVVYGSNATLLTGLLLTWLGHWPLVNAGVPSWTLVGRSSSWQRSLWSSGSTFRVGKSFAWSLARRSRKSV